MALTAVDKVKINKYLAQHSMDDIYYLDMCDALGKRGKILDVEFLEYFTDSILNGFRKDDKLSSKNVSKLVAVVGSFVEWMNDEKQTIGEDILDKIRSFKELYDDYLNRTSFENDEDISNYIDGVLKVVNKLYPTEVKNESVTKYINSDEQDKVKIIIDELSTSITYETNLMSYLDTNVKLLDYEIIDETIKLNFNNLIFSDITSNVILEEVIYTIGLSLCDELDVKEVIFQVDNQEISTFSSKTLD